MKTSNKRLYAAFIESKNEVFGSPRNWEDKYLHLVAFLCGKLDEKDFKWEKEEFIQLLTATLNDEVIELEEPKYYVRFPYFGKSRRYLNLDQEAHNLLIGSSPQSQIYKTKFTEQEIKEKWPEFWQFAVKVDDDE